MKMKYNFIFLPILIIASAAVYFTSMRDAAELKAKRLTDRALVDISDIDVIELKSNAGFTRLERVNHEGTGPGTAADWMITEPYEVGCDPTTLSALMDSLLTTEVEKDIKDISSEQKSEYGLDDPEVQVKVASSGAILMDLSFGEKNPSGSSRYASFSDDPSDCFLIPIYYIDEFEVSAQQLRDKRAIPFDPEELVSIQISSASAEFNLENKDNIWIVKDPYTFNASPARLDLFFGHLQRLAVEEFLPDGDSDPHLKENRVDVVIGALDGSEIWLTLHGEDNARGIFATSSYQPTPFIVESYIFDRLALTPSVFQPTMLIDIPDSRIVKVHVRQPGSDNLEIERRGRGAEDWKILKPSGITETQAGSFTGFINALLAIEPKSYIDPPKSEGDYGLYPGYFMMAEVTPESGRGMEEVALYFGATNSEGDYYATQDSNTYFTIDGAKMNAFIAALDKLRVGPVVSD